MLKITNQEYFDNVKAEAIKLGLLDQFNEAIDRVTNFGSDPDQWLCCLGSDFAPLSFSFAFYAIAKAGQHDLVHAGHGWRYRFNGGLIFYAGAESGADGPQFSVTNSGRSDSRWEMNT